MNIIVYGVFYVVKLSSNIKALIGFSAVVDVCLLWVFIAISYSEGVCEG